MNQNKVIEWLLSGDVSIQYLTYKNLLGENKEDLQQQIAHKGWGKIMLDNRKLNGHWGDRFYQPKWISTHYTLLDLRNLNLHPDNELVKKTVDMVLNYEKSKDGGICLGDSTFLHSDVCVNGMFLNYASYFHSDEKKLHSIVDSILNEIMPDGGFNCRTTRSGAKHSSLHTTLSVLEGFFEFLHSGYNYRKNDITKAITSSEEFILMHHLFLSDHTRTIISKDYLKFTYPCRWRYDIFRALEYFCYSSHNWDNRMEEAIDILKKKRNKNETWNMQAAHAGKVHLEMEKAANPSRWNTLRAMYILKFFNIE